MTNGSDDTGNIDLMGWDTVFALQLPALNASIVAQKTTPAQFAADDTSGGAQISGKWSPWSVIGGEGNGIIMNCPVTSGSMTVVGVNDPTPLDGCVVQVMITLTQAPASSELPDPTATAGTGNTVHFTANQTSDEFQQPRVQSITGLSGLAVFAAEAAFNTYFQNNLAEFNAVFAAARLEEQAIEAGKQWLKPAYSL